MPYSNNINVNEQAQWWLSRAGGWSKHLALGSPSLNPALKDNAHDATRSRKSKSLGSVWEIIRLTSATSPYDRATDSSSDTTHPKVSMPTLYKTANPRPRSQHPQCHRP